MYISSFDYSIEKRSGAWSSGGTATGSTGGKGELESVIPPNSDFLLVIQNKGGQTKDIGIVAEGYEE
jgi:hypothetical protein